MRHNPEYAVTDEAVARALIAANPWTTIVSQNGGELVASHYPVLLDDERPDELTVVTHVGRPDDKVHGFAANEVMLIFAGAHGYISPSWYAGDQDPIPTWNFSVVHAHGVPEVLGDADNLRVLLRLSAHFEQHVDHPTSLDPAVAAKVARGTVGLRIPISRFVCKVKMSQNKDEATQHSVIAALERPAGPYAGPALAAAMRQALGLGPRPARDERTRPSHPCGV